MSKNVFVQKFSYYFAACEPLLKPYLHEILNRTKKAYQKSAIRLISTAAVPLRNDIVKYIDRIEFSIGCVMAETFGRLGLSVKFAHILKTLRVWDEFAEKHNQTFAFFCFFVAVSTANIDESEDMFCLIAGFK